MLDTFPVMDPRNTLLPMRNIQLSFYSVNVMHASDISFSFPRFLMQRKWSKKAPAGGDCSPKSQCLGIIPPAIILYIPKTVPLMQNKNKIQLKFKKK